MAHAPADTATTHTSPTRWRTVDIVVTAVIGVAFGVVFWGWNLLYAVVSPAFTAFPPAGGLMIGIWLLPAVLAPLIIRKPGAGLTAELIAGIVSALLGNQWGLLVILSALVQGLGGELGYAAFRYRVWNRVSALVAAAMAGLAAVIYELITYWVGWAVIWQISYAAIVVPSAMLVAGLGAIALMRAMAKAGVLSAFPAGRQRVSA